MSVTFKRDHRLFLTIVHYTVCPPPYKFYVIYLTYPSSLTRIHIMSTIPVLVHPHQHHRRQDALDILELGLLLALELLGTNFIGKLFTKPVKFALKWREVRLLCSYVL